MPGRGRRHHNNTGERQIRTGATRDQVRRMAERLGVPYAHDAPSKPLAATGAHDSRRGCLTCGKTLPRGTGEVPPDYCPGGDCKAVRNFLDAGERALERVFAAGIEPGAPGAAALLAGRLQDLRNRITPGMLGQGWDALGRWA